MLKSKKIFLLIIALSLSSLISCGESVIEIGQNTYEPKIVIEAYLEVGKNSAQIRVTRNFPLNTEINPAKVFIADALVSIFDPLEGREFKLVYNNKSMIYQTKFGEFNVGYNKNYKLSVKANVDGKSLEASAITTTPQKGFTILKSESIIDSLTYREKDLNGEVKNFKIVFTPSPGTSFYALSIVALEATENNFIYENPFFEVKRENLKPDKDLPNYKYQLAWLQNINSAGQKIDYKINWLDTWFYSKYRLIVYAADDNYRKFLLTHKSVQEFDGNFHEPKMNVVGDGIGVFASYIADTLYFKVKK